MRETVFIKKNISKWKKYEKIFSNKDVVTSNQLQQIYIVITDDLSHASTFYPKSKITKYLNSLSQKAHERIYRNKKETKERFKTFWLKEVPNVLYQSRKEIKLSLIIFSLAVLIGALSSANDETFVRLILGDRYVNMTLENIKNNDPMAVYKHMNETDMFLGITLNNLMVSFVAFAYGFLFGMGTVYLLIQNGVMLGAFQYFFYQKGLLWTSFLTIWIHGTLEISTIIIMGAAGLVIGRGIVFPKTYSRSDSIKLNAKKGIKIVIGASPIIVIAGFLEAFVTRHTEFHELIKLSIIGISFLFVIGYYWIYPSFIHSNKRGTWKNLLNLKRKEV